MRKYKDKKSIHITQEDNYKHQEVLLFTYFNRIYYFSMGQLRKWLNHL